VASAYPTQFEDEAMSAANSMSDEEIQSRLSTVAANLQKLADEQVTRKREDEIRALEDLAAFHGKYDPATEAELKDTQKSRAFVKITRKKTNSWDARLSALLFPTDDENWEINATPVPTLHQAAKTAIEQAKQQVEQANQQQQQDPQAAQATAQQAAQSMSTAQQMTEQLKEVKKRSDAMQQEMQDQLIECDYAAEGRRVITDACRIGTGVLKGPMSGESSRGSWVEMDGKGFVYQRETDPAPIFKWVDWFSYFPDMSAIRPEDREFDFERHLWSAKDLRALVRERGFNPTAVREILNDGKAGRPVTDSSMSYLTQLRAITGRTDAIRDRFVGWEYHGPLKCEDVCAVLRAMGQDDAADAYEHDEDPLSEIRVICYFCEGKILKMSPAYPLDSGESLYSLFIFEPSEGSLFGYGVPRIMRDMQKAMNGALRMALDNAALSTGPQIFIDRDAVEPANRSWLLTPRKIWYKRKGASATGTVLETKDIPNKVDEIMKIVEVTRRFIDDETALPVQAEGELTDNPNITATATNFMSMASNITFRRVVKSFDDGITVPSMRKLYDWNMQFNSRDDIKGDMKVDARGSSALLQRELQSQFTLNMAQNWSSHPVLKHVLKAQGYDAAVEACRSATIKPETVLASRDEYMQSLQAEQQAAQQQEQQNPTVVAAQVRMQASEIDAKSRMDVANIQRQTEMMKLAQQYQLSVQQLQTLLGIKQMEIQHKERVFTAEAALEERRTREARAHGEKPAGSGGYINSAPGGSA
jgi:hypothetical protein